MAYLLNRAFVLVVAAVVMATTDVAPAHAAFPGRNGRIAYVRDDPANRTTAHKADQDAAYGVASVRPDGSGERYEWFGDGIPDSEACTGGCVASSVAYSPGGGRLLVDANYLSYLDRMFVVPVGRAHRVRLLRKGRRSVIGSSPSWSPDGHAVLYADPKAVTRRLRGGRTRRVGPGFDAQWTRRGRIAVVRQESPATDTSPGKTGLYTMSPSGTEVRRIAEGSSPDWSPYGQWLIYDTPGGSLVMARGPERRVVHSGGGGLKASQPAFSPDGRWVAFVGVEPNAGRFSPDLYVQRLDGSGLKKIAPARSSPSWQPVRGRR